VTLDPVYETVPIHLLKPHPQNYRSHPADQLEHIKQSIREYGIYRNIVVAEEYTILAGPGVVTTKRRYGRPQHVIDWTKFDTPLQRCEDADPVSDYNMALVQKSEIKSASLRKLKGEWDNGQG